ncbi:MULTISPECIES: acyl-CoA dehydrogenase family protein [unclassified Streptomyces]|uniref:acyl-CoA dehydrogenase family protein n=1 Tax=unclassified Streptomyces TaxID=2593676 RepID=UPI0024AA0265|nr:MULTISPECIES: acyl-CoA dehydrogenase family protein [unclassified Streptomyces]
MNNHLNVLDRIIVETVRPQAADVDREGRFPADGLEALGQAGFFGATVPTKMGGWGLSAAEISEIVRRLGTECASTAMVYVMHLTALSSVVLFGSEKQKEMYLKPVLEGTALVTEAISEAGSGSQWWSVASRSERNESGEFRIDAEKSFATSAGHANLYIVSTRSPGSDDDRNHALFVVPANTPGITFGQWNGLGLAGNSSTWINFHCDLPAEAILFAGDDKSGLTKYNEVNQPIFHLGVASVYLGIAQAAYGACVERIQSRRYADDVTTFGRNLSQYPVARRHVGTMAIKIAAGESLVARLATEIDADRGFEQLSVLMTATKVALAETCSEVAREALLASGGSAYARGFLSIERHLRDSLAASLMGPNDDFCKELIGRLELEGTSYHDL